jgi:hypothetical protein
MKHNKCIQFSITLTYQNKLKNNTPLRILLSYAAPLFGAGPKGFPLLIPFQETETQK